MRFNLVHIIPDPPYHGPLGYRETIETLEWGLTQLGHEVTLQRNGTAPDKINIVVGAQLLHPTVVEAFPDGTVIYNLEQMAHLQPSELSPVTRLTARRLQIWDYSDGNITLWRQLDPVKPPVHVPIGWAPVLERIPKPAEQDVDLLIYGVPSLPRLRAFADLCLTGARVAFLCGMYGPPRDGLIARSKVVVNVKGVHQSNVFEVVRASYLLANGKAVVSDIYPNSVVEPRMREAVAFVPFEELASECARLLRDNEARRTLEEAGPRIMRERDIRPILSRALAATYPT